MITVMIWLLVAALMVIAIYLFWRWLAMNANSLLFTFVLNMIEKVDKEAFWAEYGDLLMEKLVEKLF